jgi:tetratricopeptide (TPR) repeat protein
MKDEDIDLIERYLLGQATEKEEKSVKERMAVDQEFAEDIEFMRSVILAAREKGEETFRESLREVEGSLTEKLEGQAEKEMEQEKEKKVPLFRRPWLYYAAGIAAVVAIGIFLTVNLPGRGEQLYGEYFEPYPNEVITYARGETVAGEFDHLSQEQYNLIVRAMKYYERNEFEQAAGLFGEQLEQIPANAGLIIYMAIAEMETGKTGQAIENLRYVTHIPHADLKEQAQWYLALAYLKNDQAEAAREVLTTITGQDQHPFKEKARELLRKIK